MTFIDRYNDAPAWQIEKYEKMVTIFTEITLTENEKRYLLWLASNDYER